MVATEGNRSGRVKHVPLRRCVVCRATKPQAELVRLTAQGEGGGYVLDARGRMGGRGTWVCQDCAAVVVAGADVKRLGRAFKAQAAQVLGLLTEAARLVEQPARRGHTAVTARRDGGTDV